MEVTGVLPEELRTYTIMKAFPGITMEQVDEGAAKRWDWLLAIDNEVKRGGSSSKVDS